MSRTSQQCPSPSHLAENHASIVRSSVVGLGLGTLRHSQSWRSILLLLRPTPPTACTMMFSLLLQTGVAKALNCADKSLEGSHVWQWYFSLLFVKSRLCSVRLHCKLCLSIPFTSNESTRQKRFQRKQRALFALWCCILPTEDCNRSSCYGGLLMSYPIQPSLYTSNASSHPGTLHEHS